MKRKEGESFADYKKRRELEEGSTQIKLRPKTFWPSRRLGTYRKDGKLDTKHLEKAHHGHFPGGSADPERSGGEEVDNPSDGGAGGDK